jgi:hypothetical protein
VVGLGAGASTGKAPLMNGDPLRLMEYLNDVACDAHIDLLVQQRVRNRVVMLVDLNVVVDTDPGEEGVRKNV